MDRELTLLEKLEISKTYNDVIILPGSTRKNALKKEALLKLLSYHNDIFKTSYGKHNTTCHSCVRKIMSNMKELVEKWQINEK
ncbi:MAG: hypothetical protein CL870_03120 [Cytophagia bacterium]|nr:hypothetical protein [Cytophagia bacterium]|tara:strand:+ start:2373 stop:2621 length:249 start_codon:yes stop_codon:yes gene_type:complete